MTLYARKLLMSLFAAVIALPLAIGQARAAYSQAELDQMLAPIALYPDPLLSQILMAATYPAEVEQAARWSRAHRGVQGDAAVRMVQDRDWDPSVKSLVAFPDVLARMDENRDWTRRLGDAFIVQEPVVMETIQGLRRRAQQAGQLASDERFRVLQQANTIVIEPASPQYVYVPYYDPWIAYGPWWWPAYPPLAWAPWPGYVRIDRPGLNVGFWWGAPTVLSAGFFFGGINWPRRHVHVVRVDNYYVRPYVVNRQVAVTPSGWRRDYWQRRDFAGSGAATRPQLAAPAPVQRREEPRRTFAAPRVEAAPQIPAPRVEAPAVRRETRQSLQRPTEQQRDLQRAERRSGRHEQRVERHEHPRGGQRALN